MRWPDRTMTADLLRAGARFLAAVLVCTVAGTIVQTQFNLAALQRLGVPVPPSTRLEATAADLAGFTPSFAPLVFAGFAIAFGVAGALSRWRAAWRCGWFVAAGAAAIFTAMLLLELVLHVTPVAAVRGAGGMAALCACGALGGYVFARLHPPRRR